MGNGKKTSVGVAAAAGSLINTVFYLGLMLVFYSITGLDSAAVLGTIAGGGAERLFGGGGGCAHLCTPVVLAVNKVRKKEK